MSEQHGGEGAGRPHISAECSQSSFPAGHVDSMMASRGVLCSYEILNLLGPQVWTDHLQASVACGEPGDHMSLSNTHAQTHTCMHENILANVPTQDKPVGLHMLTLMDINTYNRKSTENMETLKLMWEERSLQKRISCSMHDASLIGFCLKPWYSKKVKLTYEYFLFSLLKQSAKAVMKNKNKKTKKDPKKTWNFQSPKRNLSLLRKAAKRTTGACRLPSPSGPRSFARRAVGP